MSRTSHPAPARFVHAAINSSARCIRCGCRCDCSVGGCGRSDFQNGDPEALYYSITERLFTLDDDTLVYPAHDYKGRRVSSIGEEKALNPRLTGKTREDFVTLMNNLGLPPPKLLSVAVPANLQGGVVDRP